MDNINIHRVLIAPLDWGLGHTTRCIPIIQSLQALNIEVVIAAEGASANLLSKEFPNTKLIPLRGYRVKYAKSAIGLMGKLLLQIPKILSSIRNEHRWLEKIIIEEKIDLVISDNRYGLYSKVVPSVFITHQLFIKAPFRFLEQIIQKINYRYINRFSSCWIPDAESTEINLAGVLSHPFKLPEIPVSYLGIVSRMKATEQEENKYNYCFLLSGPEPQRTLLEKEILKCFPKLDGNIILVRGLPDLSDQIVVPSNIKVYPHLPSKELESVLLTSELIICRSGYSSLMDLIALKKNAVIIPTPGQTEQVYLAIKLSADLRFYATSQTEADLIDAIKKAKTFDSAQKELPIFSTKTLEALLVEL